MAAVSNSLIGIYLKQFFYVADQVADFVNFYGFWKTADSFEEITWVPLSCNTSQTRTERFNEYGYGTLGITWIPEIRQSKINSRSVAGPMGKMSR